MFYRKKPVDVEAFRLGVDKMPEWFVRKVISTDIVLTYDAYPKDEGGICCDNIHSCFIATLEGVVVGEKGDYIIKGVKGEIYPCKPDIFELTYDLLI